MERLTPEENTTKAGERRVGTNQVLRPALRFPDRPGVKRSEPAATALAVVQPVRPAEQFMRGPTGGATRWPVAGHYTKLANPSTSRGTPPATSNTDGDGESYCSIGTRRGTHGRTPPVNAAE